ncbi:MAG: TRAP transporter small permease subunit, partial [Pseudomonadota bacterium]
RKIEYIKVQNAWVTENYGFSVSFILQDFQWHLHGVLLLMTFGFGYVMNAHVRVDIFREMASRRGQVKIETFGLTILALPFMMVMIGFSWDLFYASFKGWEGSESMVGLGWRWIIKSFLIWGFCVAMMAALGMLARCIMFLFGDEEDQAIAEDTIPFFTDADELAKLILEENRDAKEGGQ